MPLNGLRTDISLLLWDAWPNFQFHFRSGRVRCCAKERNCFLRLRRTGSRSNRRYPNSLGWLFQVGAFGRSGFVFGDELFGHFFRQRACFDACDDLLAIGFDELSLVVSGD